MHASVHAFVRNTLGGEHVRGSRILEVGSRNVNGSVREYLTSLRPTEYVGTDMLPGPGVDEVCGASELFKRFGQRFGGVVSTEMLEHAEHWQEAVEQMLSVLVPGGWFLLTARGPGFPLHDWPGDYWRFTPAIMADALRGMRLDELAEDPEMPGVLVFATKPHVHWRANARLRAVTALRVVR